MASIEDEVSAWPGIAAEPHRFNGREFTLGAREVGHVHGERLLDIPFAKRIRDVLVEEGEAQEHHVIPESGWISFRIEGDADREHAVWLLRLSYLYNVAILNNQGAADGELDTIDVEQEVASMDLNEDLSAVFDSLRTSQQSP
jgi:hypothetical protein